MDFILFSFGLFIVKINSSMTKAYTKVYIIIQIEMERRKRKRGRKINEEEIEHEPHQKLCSPDENAWMHIMTTEKL